MFLKKQKVFSLWQRILAQSRGESQVAYLAEQMQTRYEELHRCQPRFDKRALRYHLERQILPGIALYQALCKENGRDNTEDIMSEVEKLIWAYNRSSAQRMMLMLRLAGYLVNPFTVLRKTARWQLTHNYPAPGWEMEIIEDSHRCFAFTFSRCFYFDILTAQGVPELTPVFCKMDDLTYELLPPSIVWQRTQTLGSGGEYCDFRFCLREYAGDA